MAKKKTENKKPSYDELVKALSEAGARLDTATHELKDLQEKNAGMSQELRRMDSEVERWQNEYKLRDQHLTQTLNEHDKIRTQLVDRIKSLEARESGILAALTALAKRATN